MPLGIAPGPNGESCIIGAGRGRARAAQAEPAAPAKSAEDVRLTVIGGVLAPDRARSLSDFIRARIDPGLKITVQRSDRPHYDGNTQTNLEMRVDMGGAQATFALEDPFRYGAAGCQYGSRGWGMRSSNELARLSAFYKQGKVGEYLESGQSGARSYGGAWVTEASRRQPSRDTY